MLALVLGALRARPVQAFTVLVLATLATAAAVAGPLYTRAAEQTVLANQLDLAPVRARALQGQRITNDRESGTRSSALMAGAVPFGYGEPVTGVTQRGQLRGPRGLVAPVLTYRSDVCGYLRLVTGRCATGQGEVVLSVAMAATAGLAAGDASGYVTFRDPNVYRLRVVGTYRPRDAAEDYWAGRPLFRSSELVTAEQFGLGDAAFATEPTLRDAPGSALTYTVDAVLDRASVRLENLALTRRRTLDSSQLLARSEVEVTTGVPALIDRIRRNNELLGTSVPLVVVQLSLLCWFVLVLVVAASTAARGPELAVLRLRGLRRRSVVLLAVAEPVAPVLLAAPLGVLLAGAAVSVLPLARGPELRAPVLLAAAAACAGGVASAAVAQRRVLRLPVLELLRRVPARVRSRGATAAEGAVVALALAGVAQVLVTEPGSLGGVALLAPGLVTLLAGVVAGRLVPLLATAVARRGRSRGRSATVLGALQVGRRPLAQRVVVLVTAAVALLVFAVGTLDVADRARDRRAALEVGAPRVLTVVATSRTDVLRAVRAADPTGRHAMAVAQVGGPGDAQAPLLAVDSPRLAAVVPWQEAYGSSAAEVARLIRPTADVPATLQVRGPRLVATVQVTEVAAVRDVRLRANLVTTTGAPVRVVLGALRPGTRDYGGDVPRDCAGGCRFQSLEIVRDEVEIDDIQVVLEVRRLAQGPPAALSTLPADLDRETAWRTPDDPVVNRPVVTPGAGVGGLAVRLTGNVPEDPRILRADAPSPLPAVLVGDPPREAFGALVARGVDSEQHFYTLAGRLDLLPRLGRAGLLVDLEYANRSANDYGLSERDEVWLAAGAPADLVARLRAEGLEVTADTTVTDRSAELGAEGPALALRLYLLAAVTALILAAAGVLVLAGTGRRQRAAELAALWLAGVPRGVLVRAVAAEQAWVLGAGFVAGVAGGLVGCVLTLPVVPLFADGRALPPPDRLPGPAVVAVAAAAAAALLLVVAAAVAWLLLRRTGLGRAEGAP